MLLSHLTFRSFLRNIKAFRLLPHYIGSLRSFLLNVKVIGQLPHCHRRFLLNVMVFKLLPLYLKCFLTNISGCCHITLLIEASSQISKLSGSSSITFEACFQISKFLGCFHLYLDFQRNIKFACCC